MRALPTLLLAAILPAAAFAGTETASAPAKETVTPRSPASRSALTTIITTTDYGFHQDLKRGSGNLEVEHNNFEIDGRIPLNFLTLAQRPVRPMVPPPWRRLRAVRLQHPQ